MPEEEAACESFTDLHQIVADGQIIYEGYDWPQAFLAASHNPSYHTIIHLANGKPGARLGPMIIPTWFEKKMHD